MKLLQTVSLVLIVCLLSIQANSQIKPPFTNNALRNDLTKVISDFINNFSSLKGEVITENPQTTEYASLINFSGAERNSITKYNSSRDIYSWKAIMLSSEDFNEASKKYNWLYNQLKVMTIKLGDYSFSLDGDYEKPEESRIFCTSTFRLLPAGSGIPKLKIEVAMQFEFPEWKAVLQVFEKEREDNERGNIKEDAPLP